MRPTAVALLAVITATAPAYAVPTKAQLCESAIELASAKYAQCRMNAESKFSKTLDVAKRTGALAKCSTNLGTAFSKATNKYGAACAATEPSSAFDDYLAQCSDDASAAAAGAALPDYVGDLASCNGNLSTCDGDLASCDADVATCAGELESCNADLTMCNVDFSTCTADLTVTVADLATCEGDLAACEALPSARLLKTGQTTSYGVGSDGDLQIGVTRGYVDNGDGTISDSKTGLMWEKKSDDGSLHDKDNTYQWGLASPPYTMSGTMVTSFLAALNAGGGFAGHTDWRVPNLRELETLVNLEIALPAPSTFPAFDAGCGVNSSGNPGCTVTTCSCTVTGFYWSSSTLAYDPINAWGIDFDVGKTVWTGKSSGYRVRAVRGGS